MNVLVVWPPQVPSYFNAGHHLSVFLTAGYLRTRPEVSHVRAADMGALNWTWKEIGDLINQGQFDVLVIINDFDNIDDLPRLVRYTRALSPRTRVITAGRLSSEAPLLFRDPTLDLDAVAESGDVEAGAAAYVKHLSHRTDAGQSLPGVAVRHGTDWVEATPGIFLDSNQWCLPDVSEIPYEHYDRMYQRDQNKFCGIPHRRELVVPVARGCPIGCSFCEVPTVQGYRERRLSVERAVAYVVQSFAAHTFEYVAFYAPTFTLDRAWVEVLCARLSLLPERIPWKCATTVAHLNEELVAKMAAAGCIRISVGVETLELDGHRELPRRKRFVSEQLRHLAATCQANGIELNCFVVVGLPGTTVEGTQSTIAEIKALGARVRPTIYSSLDRLRQAETPQQASDFNRQLINPDDAPSLSERFDLHGMMFGYEDWVTDAAARIPARAMDRSADE